MRQGRDLSIIKNYSYFKRKNRTEKKYWEMLRVMHENILTAKFCCNSWRIILNNSTVVDLHDKIYLKGNFRRILLYGKIFIKIKNEMKLKIIDCSFTIYLHIIYVFPCTHKSKRQNYNNYHIFLLNLKLLMSILLP